MPRCEDWEWDVDPCNCRLKACQLDATAIATQAANAVLAAQNAGQLGPLEAQQEIEVIFQALDVIYEQCALEADACNGREPRLRPSPLPSNDKASINKHKSDMDIGIAVAGGGAIFCGGAAAAFGAAVAGPAMFIVGLGYVAVGIGFVIAKRRLDDLAIDPPDSNWDTVVLPSPPQPPDILRGRPRGVSSQASELRERKIGITPFDCPCDSSHCRLEPGPSRSFQCDVGEPSSLPRRSWSSHNVARQS
jgi:hypothetical protein